MKGHLSKLIYQYFSPSGLVKSKNITNSSRLILKEADELGVDWRITPGSQIINLTHNGETKSFYHQVPTSTTSLAKYACNNKKITSNLLQQNGIKVPKSFRIRKNHDQSYLKETYKSLKKPIVVKPSDGTWGENITVGIKSYEEYLSAIELALSYSSKKNSAAIAEEFFSGTEYRVLVTRDKVIGVLYRMPANVVGNGKHSIKRLIKEKNNEEIRGVKGGGKSHLKIRIDKRLVKFIEEQGLSLKTVVPKGKRIILRRISNISQGGDAIDFTDKVHPSVKEISLKAINSIPGLSFAGIDFMSKDITKKQTKDSYVIIEINDSPGFDIHDIPYEGKNRHAAREFLYLIFPELEIK